MEQVMVNTQSAATRMIEMAQTLQTEAVNMKQIDERISQMTEIVDSNSASSEETAAVSEEQSALVQTMVHMMDQFTI